MRLLTNPGSNLSPEQIARYGVTLLPQRIVVDGVPHDTREPITFETVDGWVERAARWPATIGTTATETVAAFQATAREGERDIVVVTTSKKVINSYDSAVLASETFLASPQGKGCRIAVVDSGVTDIGTNLVCTIAGEAMRANVPWVELTTLLKAAAHETRLVFSLATLDNMVKGGRASFLRRFVADVLGLRPILTFLPDGTMESVATYKRRGESLTQIASHLGTQVEPGRKVWIAAFHTGEPGAALTLIDDLRKIYDVQSTVLRPLAPGVYLHCGPGAVGAAVCPVDRLGWKPPPLGH